MDELIAASTAQPLPAPTAKSTPPRILIAKHKLHIASTAFMPHGRCQSSVRTTGQPELAGRGIAGPGELTRFHRRTPGYLTGKAQKSR